MSQPSLPKPDFSTLRVVQLGKQWWIVDDWGFYDGPIDSPKETQAALDEWRKAYLQPLAE